MIYIKKKEYFSNLFISRNTLFYMKTYEDICQCYATNLFLGAFKFYCDDKRKRNTTRNYSCLTKKKKKINSPNYEEGTKKKFFLCFRSRLI